MRTVFIYGLSVFTVIFGIAVFIGVVKLFFDHFSCSIPGERDCGETFALFLEAFVIIGLVVILFMAMYANLIHL